MSKIFVSFTAGVLFAFTYELIAGFIGRQYFNKESLVVNGFKLHHSLYGVISLLIYFFSKKSFYLGFGLGIIFQHTITDGFKFIQKV